jgi:hypothetical protein
MYENKALFPQDSRGHFGTRPVYSKHGCRKAASFQASVASRLPSQFLQRGFVE